ncbi:MAG: hypothetical protein A2W19_04565 [Spirochaetes bacterium RBG_16_49_21]|nr:MAG: hypothetical protein A2W19_04565 [Spirochaetes bacterium RBG_16_49_21]
MTALPEDKRFTRDHVWIEMDDGFVGRCGLTECILEKINDVVYVDLPEINMKVKIDERVCFIESDVDIFDLKSPVSGRITEINRALEFDPELINREPYDNGWIFKIEVKEPNEFKDLLDFDSYRDFIESRGF